MLTLSKTQLGQRWDTLPPILRDALFSEANGDFIYRTCETEHVPKEKIYDVLGISGYVLMGFLHPEDLALELKDALGLDPQTAGTISQAIDSRIYTPLRDEINKVFAPPSRYGTDVPKLIDVGGIGSWERKPFTAHEGTSSTPKTATTAPSSSVPPSFGGPATKPSMPASNDQEPAPVIIHEEPGAKPLTPGFKISMPSPKFSDTKQAAPAPKPAVLELGGNSAKSAPSFGEKVDTQKMRVVHYTDMRTTPGESAGTNSNKPAGFAPMGQMADQKPMSPQQNSPLPSTPSIKPPEIPRPPAPYEPAQNKTPFTPPSRPPIGSSGINSSGFSGIPGMQKPPMTPASPPPRPASQPVKPSGIDLNKQPLSSIGNALNNAPNNSGHQNIPPPMNTPPPPSSSSNINKPDNFTGVGKN